MGGLLASGGQSDIVRFMAGAFPRLAAARTDSRSFLHADRCAFISKRGSAPGGTTRTSARNSNSSRIVRSTARHDPRRRRRAVRFRCATSASALVRSTSRRYSTTSGKRCRIACSAPGWTLLPRSTIMSSARPRMPPSSRGKTQPHGHGCGSTRHQIAGAIAEQRTAPAAEIRQHQFADVPGRHVGSGRGIDHLRDDSAVSSTCRPPGLSTHSAVTGPISVMPL